MANGGMSAYNKQAEKTANPGKAYIENNISEFSNNKSNKAPLMSKSAEKPSLAQAIPFVADQTAKADNMFKQAEDVHNKAYSDAGQAFSKYGNSEAFRASLVDNDANYRLGDADEESKKVYTNTVSSLYTESFLRELSENPTIENYNKFVNAYNTKPFAKAKIGDMDALDFANSIMYAGNSEFRNRKINNEIEKYSDEIKKNEKEIEAQEKLKAEYDKKGGNWFNDVVDTVVQIGTAGIARDAADKATERIKNRSKNENRAKETQNVINALEKEKSYNEKMRDAVEAALRTTYNVTSTKDFNEVLNSLQNKAVVSGNSDVFDINGRGRTGREIINNTEFDTKYGGANSDGLTKEQVDVFNYLLAKEGKESAQKYLDDMEILTSDVAFQKQYAKIKDNKFFGGIAQVNQGLTNVLSAPVRAVKSVVSDYNEYEIKPVGEKISDAYIQDAGTLGRISYGLLRSGTELAPSMLLGGMGFAKAGKLLFSTNVYANSFKEAKEKGYGKGKAIIYGLSNAVIENALESMGGQKIGDDIFKVASSKVDDALRNSTKLKFIGYQFETLAKTMGEEAFEEYAAETIAPILKNALFGEKNKFTLMSKEQIESSISGALLGGLLSTAGAIPRVSNVLKNDYNFDKSVYLSMDDSKAIDLYMDRITDNMITYSLSKKIDGFDTKTQEEKDALILKERQNMRKRISASEAKEALSEEYRLSAVVSLYEEAAKDGISMEETAKLAKKKGIDTKGFEDFAKEAYKIGQAEALTKDIDTDILRRSAISKVTNENPEIVNAITPILSKSTSEILDTLGEQFPTISREDAFKLVTSIKNKQFYNRLPTHLTNEDKAQEIVKYIESENKKEDLYNANKSYVDLVDVLNREGDNKLVVATDAISNSIVNAIKSKINAEAPIENINKTINDALTEKSFNKLSFIASLANTYTEALKGKNANVYLAVANSGIDVPSALVYYNTSGVIPSGVNANAFAILGNSFNSIAEPALTQTEAARKAISTETVSDVSESENSVVEAENNVQNEIESIADYIKAAFKEFANARISKKSIKDFVAEALLKDKSNAEIIKGLAELYTNSLELKKSKDLDILKRGKTDTNAAVETLTEYVLSNTVTDGNDAKKVMKAASAFKQVAGSALSYIESAKAKTMKTNVDKSEVKTSEKVSKPVEEAIPKVIPEATEDIKTTEKSIKPAEEITEITTDVPNKNDNSKVFNSEADKMETEEKTSEIISEQNEADDITKEAVKKTNEENISVSEETSVLENKAVETEKADENKSSDNNDALELTDKCELIATKHTQTGDDIYVITVKDRLSKEQFGDLSDKVKAVGGYYSRFAKTPDGKAIPEFVFKSEPSNDVIKVFNDFFGESTSAEDDNTQVENKSDVKESNIKEIDTNALFGALKNAKDGDEVKLSDYEKQKTNDEVLNKQSESDIIEEKTDVEADTNDREQSGILAAESEGHITGNETEEVQDDEEGRDIGGSDGDISELEETDEFVLSAKQGMAVATGNPLILKKVEIDEEVKRLQGLKKSYDASIYDMQDRLAKLPGEIEATKLALSRTKEDIKTLEENNSEDFSIKLAGKVYDKRADAAKALVPLIKNKYGATGSEVIGVYRGLNLTLTKSYAGGILYIGNKSSMKVELSDSAEGNITRITNAASRFDSYAEFLSKRVTTLDSELKSIKNDIDLPFKYQSQLDKAIAEQADIDSQLNFGEDSSDVFEDMNDKFKSQEELDEEERESEEEENDSDEKTKYFLERRKESEQQTERKSLLHGRTGQTDIQSSGKQDERLYGDAGAKAGRTFEERRNYAKEIVSQKGYFDIVDEDGHVKFIDEKFLNDEMRNIESLCYKFGRNVRFMLGGMYVKDYGTAYGVKTKNNEILVSYTAAESPWQICRHEIIHTEFNNERFQKYKKVVTDYLTGDVLEKALLLPRYQNYSEFMKTTQDVIEEMICDIFAGSAPEELALFDDTVEAYWKDTLGTNGSPVWLNELMSDDLFKNNKPFLSTEDGADFEESEYEFSDEWEDKVEEFGAIQQGENPVREVNVPKKISKTQPVSRFARTMMEAEVTPEFAMSEFEKLILDGTMVHEVITNDAARKKAEEDIRYDGFEDALTKWIGAVDTGNFSKYLIVKGQVLYNQCITNKDVANAMRVAAELTAMATQAGQTLQACRVLKLMSPDGQLYYLEKSVKKMNDELRQQIGDKYENIILDDDLMEAFLNATSEDAKNAAYDDLCQDIADQIPSTFRDKWDSWRYLAMLGNPRTHVRNVLGNGSFWLATRLKEFVAVGVEKAFKVPKEERMRSVYRSKEALEFAKKDAEKVKEQLMGNGKFSFGGFVRDKRTIYDTKWLENLRQKNFKALEWEDWLFLESHYMDALSRIITIRNVDVNNLNEAELENLRTYAIKKAKENTFREMTAAAKAINTVKHRAAHSRSWFIRNIVSPLIEGTIAFTTVPINVVKQGVLYTPAGIASGIMKNIAMIKQNGDVSVQDAIDDIAKGLTGTGFLLLGMLLRSLNLISGGDEEDEKKKAFDKMVGEQSYSITILGHSFDINWANPINIPLFVGAELTDLLKGEGFTLAQCIEVLSGMTDPVFELSFLSGVTRLLSSFGKDGSEKVSEVVIEMLTSYIMQGVPTLGGALSRIIDSQKRDYYYVDKNNKYLPAATQRLIGEASSKIPLMSYLFAPSVDNWGRDESYGGTLERVFENTVLPGYYSKENYTEVDEELLRLYNQTGDNAVFPPSISKYFKEDGERFDFTADEYASYKRDRGQRGFKYVYELINSSSYARMSDNEKVKAIEKCYDRAREEAKLKYLGQPIPEVIDAFGRGDDYKSYSEKQAVKNGYFSSEDYDNVEINLTQLMEDNNIDNLYPTVQSDYYTYKGVKYEMTPDQHAEAQKIRGKKSMELLVAFFNDENLRHGIKRYSRCKNDAEIIEAIKDIYSYAGEYTKDIMFDKVKSNKK